MKSNQILLILLILLVSCNRKVDIYSEVPLTREQLIEKYQYNWISEFSEGKALVYNDNSCYVIDEYGRKLFDFPYMGRKFNFRDNYAIVQDGLHQGVIDYQGNLISGPNYLGIRKSCPELNRAKTKDYQDGFLDITSNTFYPIDSLHVYADPISSNLILNKKNEKWGLINNKGDIIVPYVYDYLSPLNSGGLKAQKENKYGIINETNEILTPFIYDKIVQKKISDKHIIVSMDGMKGVIDKNNNILLPLEYEVLTETKSNLLKFSKGNQTGFLNESYEVISEDQAIKAYRISEHFTTFENEGKKGIKNEDGVIIHEAVFDNIKRYNDKHIEVTKDGLKNMLNDRGGLIFDQYYDRIFGVGDFAKLRKNDLWGLKTKWDKEIIAIAYSKIEIEDGGIIVTKGKLPEEKYGLYDFNGNEILETRYKDIEYNSNLYLVNNQDSCWVL